MEKIIEILIEDEKEAIRAYENAIKELADLDEELVAKLEEIKKQEEEHIEILKGLLPKNDIDFDDDFEF